MAGAKGVVCYFDGSAVKFESFQTTKNTRPTLQATPTGYTLNGAHKTSENSIICKFTRIVTVPSGSENLMYDITDGLYQLYAHGGFKDDLIEYHGLNGAAFSTDEKVDLTSPEKSAEAEVTTDECGKSLTCYKQPNDATCTSSDTCNVLVTWKHNKNANTIDVTLATKADNAYISWAQTNPLNPTAKMAGAKGVVCYFDGSTVKLESFQTTKNTRPTLQATPTGYNLNGAHKTNKNSIICKFTRIVTVPSGSENLMYDITDELYQLYAHGGFKDDLIEYHGLNGAAFSTDEKVDLTSPEKSAEAEVTTDECGKSLTCYKQPNDATCTSSDTCNVLVMWKHDKSANTIDVTLATKADNAYISWAQTDPLNPTAKMTGAKGVVCYFDGSTVKLESFQTTKNTRPTLQATPTGYTLNGAHKTNKNSIICKLTRIVTVPSGSENLMYDITDGLYQLYAHGGFKDDLIEYHGLNGAAFSTDEKVDLTSPEKSVEDEVTTTECGKSLTCYKQPNDATCTSSDTCDVLVMWKHDENANTIDVTLTTKADNAYISWAQTDPLNPTAKMTGAKGVVCYFDGSTVKLESFQTTKNTRPTLQATPTGYTLNGAHKTNKNSIICKLTRIVTVPIGSENLMYDITDGLYQLYAHGGFKDDLIEYHGLNGAAFFTDEKVDLTSPEKSVEAEVTTTECGKSLTCYKQPNDATCTSSDTCNVLVTWKHDKNANTIDVTLATKADNAYIGWAQTDSLNHTAKMTGAKGVVCYFDGSAVKLESFQTTKNTRPTLQVTPTGYTLNGANKTNKNSIICKFTRIVTVPSGSENLMYDITDGLYQLYAHGGFKDNLIEYHGLNGAAFTTDEKVDLTSPEKTVDTPKPRITIPADCTDCDAVVEFQYDEPRQMMVFTLQTKHAWVASAQRPQSAGAGMVNIKGQYCVKDGGFGSFDGSKLIKNTAPSFSTGSVDGVTLKSTKTENGVTTCIYERPIKPSDGNAYLHDLNDPMVMVVAFGKSASGNSISYHDPGNYAQSKRAFKLTEASAIEATSGRTLAKKEIAHGILMIVSWVIFATIGIFMARYMKQATKDQKINGKQAWFPIHQMFMLLCVICFLIGFILIFVEKAGWVESAGTHGQLGLVVVILGLIQPLMAMVRCAPDSEKRFIFNWFHRTFGMSAWIIGGVCIIFAFDKILQESYTEMLVFMIVVVVLFILLDIVICASSKNSASADVAYRAKSDSVDVQNTSSASNTTIPTIFCVVVALFAAAMGIYHVYIIGTYNDGN
ncbi:uncharacterized protein [Clytia hemisphaerica]|uniref:uncharacterized protein n=1 Tax=Clytia hemisphaerica TaxID=252671 RepID=UPI0034D5CFFB